MKDPRVPDIVYIKKLPRIRGRKAVLKVELYPARLWSDKFSPSSPQRNNCIFLYELFGKLIKKNMSRSNNIDGYYRLMVNGSWYSENKRYEFYTQDKAFELLRRNDKWSY